METEAKISGKEAAESLKVSRPNGVVLENSRQDESDMNAQGAAALHNLLQTIKVHAQAPPSQDMQTERNEI